MLSVRYGGVTALDAVSLELSPGERVGLIGPNGAGKTTLLDAISGFVEPFGGAITLDSRDITKLGPRARSRLGLCRTFQGLRLFAGLSIGENVEVAALAAGRSRKDARRRATELLERLHLSDRMAEPCASLPTGLAQRVGLARALAADPTFLLLDEPAAGLSGTEADQLADMIRDASKSGTTVLIVDHDMEFVSDICERTYVLSEGRKIFEGPVEEALADPAVQSAYLGSANLVTSDTLREAEASHDA